MGRAIRSLVVPIVVSLKKWEAGGVGHRRVREESAAELDLLSRPDRAAVQIFMNRQPDGGPQRKIPAQREKKSPVGDKRKIDSGPPGVADGYPFELIFFGMDCVRSIPNI